MILGYLLSFMAGALTTLSPCVLPILPFVLSSALSKNKFGPLALSFGVVVSFTVTTIIISLVGHLFGFSPDSLKIFGAVFLFLGGIFFLSQNLSDRLTEMLARPMQAVNNIQVKESQWSFWGLFLSGLVLGIVWTPCSGPSLGIAIGFATKAETIGQAGLLLFAFALGSTTPLLALAYGAKSLMAKAKANIKIIFVIKKVFGSLMIIAALLMLTGLDKKLEARIVSSLPEWWIDLTTKY
ncbi:MAG: hypothetical protein B7Y39_05540 [Bdellovibrio sp. 28-41-41]|nr:MAG: hypothetical protein B7Y39_05540 [Bdellovibrio sp. 28-41-41]